MQAYEDAGIRATVAIYQPNVVEYEKYPYLRELLPAEARDAMDRAPWQSGAELLALYDYLFSRWHGAAVAQCDSVHPGASGQVAASQIETPGLCNTIGWSPL